MEPFLSAIFLLWFHVIVIIISYLVSRKWHYWCAILRLLKAAENLLTLFIHSITLRGCVLFELSFQFCLLFSSSLITVHWTQECAEGYFDVVQTKVRLVSWAIKSGVTTFTFAIDCIIFIVIDIVWWTKQINRVYLVFIPRVNSTDILCFNCPLGEVVNSAPGITVVYCIRISIGLSTFSPIVVSCCESIVFPDKWQ